MDERLVIIGRRSHIGGYLTDYAAARGFRVTAVSSEECDLLDESQVARFFRSLGPEPCVVVFLAVINRPQATSFEHFMDNVRMVKHVIEGQVLANVASLVYFSSADVYGRRPLVPMTERSPLEPDSWYALSKVVGEWMLREPGAVRCPVTVLRIPGVYGPAANDRSVIGRIVASIRTRRQAILNGPERRRDYVLLDDLCRLLLEHLVPLRHDGVLNIAAGAPRSLAEIVTVIRQVLETDFDVVVGPSEPERNFDLVFDLAALRALVPSFQFTDLAAGIRTYLHHAEHAETLR